jgi:hypothetical protein
MPGIILKINRVLDSKDFSKQTGLCINNEMRKRIVRLSKELDKKGYFMFASGERRQEFYGIDPVRFLITSIDMTHFDETFSKLEKKFNLQGVFKIEDSADYKFDKSVGEYYRSFNIK